MDARVKRRSSGGALAACSSRMSRSQTFVQIIRRVCLAVASALNTEEKTRGEGWLIDSLESGKPDVEGAGGVGWGEGAGPDVLARCC